MRDTSMYETVSEILSKHVKKGETLIVGVSGGPDSMALLACLRGEAKQTPFAVVVAHLNHGLRGRASDEDERFVKKIAKQYDFPFESKKITLADSHIEEEGRKERRRFFEELLLKYNAPHVLTAHTEDDQIETIVFNFLRGSGVRGLAGMRTQEGPYLKPMLRVSREKVISHCKENELEFRIDATNEDTAFKRNFLRNTVLPLLESVNPSWRKTVLRNRAIFRSLDTYLQNQAERFIEAHSSSMYFRFPRKSFCNLPVALQSAVLQTIYRRFTGSSYQLSSKKIEEILLMIEKGVGRKQIVCNKRGRFMLEKGDVSFHN